LGASDANGLNSLSAGNGSVASGADASIALGYFSKATKERSIALGD